jgi:hypothetical protein
VIAKVTYRYSRRRHGEPEQNCADRGYDRTRQSRRRRELHAQLYDDLYSVCGGSAEFHGHAFRPCKPDSLPALQPLVNLLLIPPLAATRAKRFSDDFA